MEKIKYFFSITTAGSHEKTMSLCKQVLEDTLFHCKASGRYSPERINLREVLMERVAMVGCAKAIIFLYTYYWKNTSNDLQQFEIIINKI
jgi:hypothetical protein